MDGGLGVRVAQVVGGNTALPDGVRRHPGTYAESGQPEEMMEKYGLVAENVADAARKVLARKK